eukprot:CAMPEP_0197244080 /NCGR_PEP_ID=MMETSP1429-20130617/9312_1 /TAXON_ID=49237 /ORGANISM="Chaetoceros  sp., Strain UNC1202" /LENGTH=741 /DNA_ID=CAMNT_0042704383 /DNA_START=308 /DNA_END=2533 /DNA_ORIENTATION=+
MMITEVAHPQDANNVRYIEIYNPSCRDLTIDEDITVGRIPLGSVGAVETVNLRGVQVPSDGFIIICFHQIIFQNTYNGSMCDKASGVIGPSSVGTDTYVIYSEADDRVIDIYGSRQTTDTRDDQDITNGRAVRKTSTDSPSSLFRSSEWFVFGTQDVEMISDMDPREWVTPQEVPGSGSDIVLIITELVHPFMTTDTNSPKPIFIELYCPNRDDWNTKIGNLHLILYSGGSTYPDRLDLSGKSINSRGFLTICNLQAYNEPLWKSECAYYDKFPSGVNGGDTVTIAKVDKSGNILSFVDTYGVRGNDGTGGTDDFTNGRAVRIRGYDTPNANGVFVRSQWRVYRYNNHKVVNCNPGVWIDEGVPLFSLDCTFLLTELADPQDSPNGRFVEIYTKECGGQHVPPGWEIATWRPYQVVPVTTSIAGRYIPEDGIFVVCVSAAFTWIYGFQCDVISGSNSAADVAGGVVTVAVRKQGISKDVYGSSNVYDGADPNSNFLSGRAVRLKDSDAMPTMVWNPDEWIVMPGRGSMTARTGDCDPGDWVVEDEPTEPLQLIITELCDNEGKYVELHSPNYRSRKITEDIFLVRSSMDDVSLKGYMLDHKGFIVLCGSSAWSAQCNYVLPYGSMTETNGNAYVALRGLYGPPDVYVSQSSSSFVFTGGRAVRSTTNFNPDPWFSFSDSWAVISAGSGCSASTCDPGYWAQVVECDTSPTAPNSAPTGPKGKGKGKGQNSRKRRLRTRSSV